jgi:hypothetical protein
VLGLGVGRHTEECRLSKGNGQEDERERDSMTVTQAICFVPQSGQESTFQVHPRQKQESLKGCTSLSDDSQGLESKKTLVLMGVALLFSGLCVSDGLMALHIGTCQEECGNREEEIGE